MLAASGTSAARDAPSPAVQLSLASPQHITFLVVLSVIFVVAASFARPFSRPIGVAALPTQTGKTAAVVFFGNPGAVHLAEYPPQVAAAAAARIGFETVQRRVLAPNVQRGWSVDVIFHTWHEHLEAELAAFMAPTAHAAGMRGFIEGRGMSAAIESALAVMRAHVAQARGGAAYDRVLLVRYDAVFYTDFLFDKLRESDALYAASWCKAQGNVTRDGGRLCRELLDNGNDFTFAPHGIPEFYLAGAPAVLWRTFHGLHEWMLTTPRFPQWAAVYATGANPNTHFIFGQRVLEQRTKLRRYLQHHMDVDIVRFSDCNGTAVTLPTRLRTEEFGTSWLHRFDADVSDDERSYCGRGEAFCANAAATFATCQAFDLPL